MTTDDLLQSYFVCRKNKRKTASAIVYEMDYESRLIALRDRINARTYQPGKSICFVVTRPRYREVFAASFEDRIIHHYIANRLEPLFEAMFSPRTFNCRKGKGQLYGIHQLESDMWHCSRCYTADCYVMKLDLKGFFMSIDKLLLRDMLDRYIVDNYKGDDIDDLRYLCDVVIMHEPEKHCERHSPVEMWQHLPPNKSLFTNGEGCGLAIGNLFSQIFANFLLDSLDKLVEEMGFIYHGRYVDDFYLIHEDKAKLLAAMPKIREHLAKLGLALNEKKFYCQHYTKGVEFTGTVVKPRRTYTCNRTVKNLYAAMRRLNKTGNLKTIERILPTINSYLGILSHTDSYAIRRKLLGTLSKDARKYVYIKGDYEYLVMKKRYTKQQRLYERIYNERIQTTNYHPQRRIR